MSNKAVVTTRPISQLKRFLCDDVVVPSDTVNGKILGRGRRHRTCLDSTYRLLRPGIWRRRPLFVWISVCDLRIKLRNIWRTRVIRDDNEEVIGERSGEVVPKPLAKTCQSIIPITDYRIPSIVGGSREWKDRKFDVNYSVAIAPERSRIVHTGIWNLSTIRRPSRLHLENK